MNFQELLNEIFKALGCTQTELSSKSSLSKPVISRYLSGEREPAVESKQLEDLCRGLSEIANAKKLDSITLSNDTVIALHASDISDIFTKALILKDTMYQDFISNFDLLITTFNINMKKLAATSNFDVSYLYRVRSGERHPSNLENFCKLVAEYFLNNHNSENDHKVLASLIGCSAKDLSDADSFVEHFCAFMLSTRDANDNDISPEQLSNFLHTLDDFDLDEFMRSIHFDDVKLPSVPFYWTIPKNYYGVEQMRKGELDFFKSTIMSKSKEPVFMCSDMPMDDMAEDMDFNKKWMFAIAMSIKKGLHLNVIHNIDRPFNEMMLGLEAWIPIYMTGQVSPFHLENVSTDIYHHFNYVSGAVALTGECINGYHDHGKYYLTGNKEEVAFYQKKAKDLLSHAKPLMRIYRSNEKKNFHSFIKSSSSLIGKRHNILSAPPLYTIPDSLLIKMLERSSFTTSEQKQIVSYVNFKKKNAEKILENNDIFDEILELSEEEFNAHPVVMPLCELFTTKEIVYTYEEYRKHLMACRDYAINHKNYQVELTNEIPFRNIQIQILEDNYVLISKAKSPAIHFEIRHPKMVYALSHFVKAV